MLPAFEMTNVRLLDERGRDALRLPRVLVSLSPRSILGLKFDQFYIDRPTWEPNEPIRDPNWLPGPVLEMKS